MKVKVKKILEQAMLSTRQEKKWWKTYQASDVSVQLDIVEVVAGGVNFPWSSSVVSSMSKIALNWHMKTLQPCKEHLPSAWKRRCHQSQAWHQQCTPAARILNKLATKQNLLFYAVHSCEPKIYDRLVTILSNFTSCNAWHTLRVRPICITHLVRSKWINL